MEQEFLTIEEAQRHTGFSRTTLLRYADRKVITKYVRGIGIRPRVFFDKSELDSLMSALNDIRPDNE